MPCKNCGEEHPPPDLSEVVAEVMRLVHSTTTGPAQGAAVLAVSLGRLCEVFNVDVAAMVKLVRASHAMSRTVSESGPLPNRGTEWAC